MHCNWSERKDVSVPLAVPTGRDERRSRRGAADWTSTPPQLEQCMEQKLAIPFRTQDRGVDEIRLPGPKPHQGILYLLNGGQLHALVSHNPALPHVLAPGFELWFHQHDDAS